MIVVGWWPAAFLGAVDALALSNNNIIKPPTTTFSYSCKLLKLPSPIISASTRCLSNNNRSSMHPTVAISLALAAENNGDNVVSSNNDEFTVNNYDEPSQVDTHHHYDPASADAQQHPTTSSSPPFLSLAYSLAAILNVTAAMSLLWGSCSASSTSYSYSSAASAPSNNPLLSNNYHYWDPTFTSSLLSYLLLGAGTCQLLSYITKQHPPPQDDTTILCGQQQQLLQLRQRLTIGTFLFGTIGLFSIPGEASYHYHNHQKVKLATTFLLCQLSKLITAAISFIGWKDTILPAPSGGSSSRGKNILREIINGLKSTWETMPISNTHPPSFYRTFFILITLGNVVWNVPNLIFYLREMGLKNWCSMPISLIVSSIGRGSLLSVILFVLKEEHASRSSSSSSDGGRKKVKGSDDGTSLLFVVLNMLVGLWAWGGECVKFCA